MLAHSIILNFTTSRVHELNLEAAIRSIQSNTSLDYLIYTVHAYLRYTVLRIGHRVRVNRGKKKINCMFARQKVKKAVEVMRCMLIMAYQNIPVSQID